MGLQVVLKEVVAFINLNLNGTLIMNDLVAQDENSEICGELNVTLVHYLAAGRSYLNFLDDHKCARENELRIKRAFAPLMARLAHRTSSGAEQVCEAARESLLAA